MLDTETQTVAAPKNTAQAAATPLPYRRDIDGLRAVAVLSVVVCHAFPALLRGGFIGVDVFFVISGFLISSILMLELELAPTRGRFSIAGFYARRVRRIFPALVAVLAACLAFGWFALFPDEYQQLGKHVVGGAGFVANLFYWAQVGYFDTAAETKPLLHLWSLGIEEQFYIAWPLLLLGAWRWRRRLFAITLVLALVSFAVNVGGIAHDAAASFYSPASRAWELLAGALLAMAGRQGLVTSLSADTRYANLASAAGLLLLGLGLAFVTSSGFPGWQALVPVLAALLLIGAGPRAFVNRVLLGNPLMVGIGLISYPLYLWHWPLLAFAHIVESHQPATGIRVAAVGAAAVLAWLSYVVLEKPVRRAGQRRGRAMVALLAVSMTGMLALGASIYLRDGLPLRKPVQDSLANQKALKVFEDRPKAAACRQRYGFKLDTEYCQIAHADREPTVALLGDSHAFHVVAGLMAYYDALGENLVMFGTRHPYWNLPPGDDEYQKATQPMLELAMNTPSVKTVVFSTHVLLDRKPKNKIIVDAARDTYRRFIAAGKHVIVIEDIPILPFDPRSCIKRAGVASSATTVPCSIPRSDWERFYAPQAEIHREFARDMPQIEWFRAADVLCDAKTCHAMRDGRLMYRDNNHLSHEGDLLVGRYFAKRPVWQPPK